VNDWVRYLGKPEELSGDSSHALQDIPSENETARPIHLRGEEQVCIPEAPGERERLQGRVELYSLGKVDAGLSRTPIPTRGIPRISLPGSCSPSI